VSGFWWIGTEEDQKTVWEELLKMQETPESGMKMAQDVDRRASAINIYTGRDRHDDFFNSPWETVFPTTAHEPPDALFVHGMAVFGLTRPHWGHGPSDFCRCQVICRTP
jgi:hypothetical protein